MAPQSRAEATAKIRALAQCVGGVRLQRRAQARMESLGYDIDDVRECLRGLYEGDCVSDGAPEHPEKAPNGWMYEFVTDFGDDGLYLKVCLNPDNVYVLSFKLDGSPA